MKSSEAGARAVEAVMNGTQDKAPILSAAPLADPVADRLWHRMLMGLVRFRAWLLGGVYTAGALVVVLGDDNSLLLVKQPYREGWGLPGGSMKRGEQSSAAVRREMLEETGIEIEVTQPYEVYVQPGRRHIDHLFFVTTSKQTPTPRVRYEISETSWHPIDNLPVLQREAYEALRRLMDH